MLSLLQWLGFASGGGSSKTANQLPGVLLVLLVCVGVGLQHKGAKLACTICRQEFFCDLLQDLG
jgi:hypothetical protein